MQPGVQRLARAHDRAALAYLAQAPFENVFLTWLISADGSAGARSALYVYLDRDSRVRGVAFFGRQIVLAAQDEDVIAGFVEIATSYRMERMIVGPRQTIERYWNLVNAWHASPRIVRASQPVLALDRPHLRGSSEGVLVRRARPSEWEIVAHNSAKMIEQELEYDPRSLAAEFNSNVRMMIDRALWWVGEWAGQICFLCNAGPRSSQTLQLQGIWTPPSLRGKGLATASLHGICAELLREVPSVCLYVNSFNDKALALYDRAGFRRVSEFQTLLF